MRDLVVTQKGIFLVGREVEKGSKVATEVVSRHINWNEIHQISFSTRKDDLVVIHVTNSYDSLLKINFKTEFITVVKKIFQAKTGKDLRISFSDR